MVKENGIKKGDIVTWGSGSLRGEVVAFTLFNTGLEATVRLVAAGTGSCGRQFPPGTQGSFPVSELRTVS